MKKYEKTVTGKFRCYEDGEVIKIVNTLQELKNWFGGDSMIIIKKKEIASTPITELGGFF